MRWHTDVDFWWKNVGIEMHTSNICTNYARIQNEIDELFLLWHFKAYENAEKSIYWNLMMPQLSFYNYKNDLENIFIDRYPIISIKKWVGIKLKLSRYN